jgi:hypothetical protein
MGGGLQGFIAARAAVQQKTVHANIIEPDHPVRSFKGTMTVN